VDPNNDYNFIGESTACVACWCASLSGGFSGNLLDCLSGV
jgi:hypothetical protein